MAFIEYPKCLYEAGQKGGEKMRVRDAEEEKAANAAGFYGMGDAPAELPKQKGRRKVEK
jgi:hypothetical protein